MISTLLHRRVALCAIGLLIALLMLPNLIWLDYSQALATWVQALVLPIVLLALLFAFLGRWPWLACLLLAPFALLAPLEAFYVATYQTPSTAKVIATLATTNLQEARGYVGPLLLVLIAAPLAGFVLALFAAWLSRRSRLLWRDRTREWIIAIAIATPIGIFAVGASVTSGNIGTRVDAANGMLSTVVDSFQQGFPFGIVQRYGEYRREWASMRKDARKFQDFTFHARRMRELPGQRQVYVLVIGESSARDHWQLFGYGRTTNPELSKLRNLVPITRMVTSWPETLAAVPQLLTRKPITSSQPGWREPSFLPAMQEAGYTTWWISNQYPLGKFDSPVAMYAYEAQHVVWLNHTATWDNPGGRDEDLIRPLKAALASSQHDLFIVLHMMGSHAYYDYRYPHAFARFTPTQSDRHSDVTRYARIRNSYDNTIVYTDHVLAAIIDALKHSGAVTALWYESDHGELLPSPGCDKQGHGIGTWHEFEIPALFWYSDAYQRDFPRRVATLRANAGKRSLSADTFESLIDMAGVAFPGNDETWSLFSPRWHYRTRWVSQFWRANFDDSVFGKKCGVVMPANPQQNAG